MFDCCLHPYGRENNFKYQVDMHAFLIQLFALSHLSYCMVYNIHCPNLTLEKITLK